VLPIGCAAFRFATPQGATCVFAQDSTSSKLGTLVPVFVCPGTSWLRGRVPSLLDLLPMVGVLWVFFPDQGTWLHIL